MTNSDPVTDDELLSAYLDGELPDAEARRLEDRVYADPELRGRLLVMHDALVALRGLDLVEPPAGYEQRLWARLDHVRAGTAVTAAGAVRPLPTAPARRGRRGWTIVGLVAAAVAAAAVVGGSVLEGLQTSGGGEQAVEDAAAPAEESRQRQRMLQGEAAQEADRRDATIDGLGDGLGPEPPRARGGKQPVLADEAALRNRYEGLPTATTLLGQPRAAAGTAAAQARERIAASELPASLSCLATVAAATGADSVPVVAEPVIYRGVPGVAYVLVTAAPDAETLSRVEVRVVDPATCQLREVVPLESKE
jgi:anti-sigma factor RsiW